MTWCIKSRPEWIFISSVHCRHHREKVVRRFKKDDSAILTGLRLYHNLVHTHYGLPDNRAPGEAAGIHAEGDNK